MHSLPFRSVRLLIAVALAFAVTALKAQYLTVQVGAPPNPPTPLVSHSDTWFFHKGTNAPQANWQTISDATLNADWGSGPGGFGYGDNGITNTAPNYESTLLPDMQNRYTTLFIRKTFTVSSPVDTGLDLLLTVDYDDGFVAYLDGVEIRRANTTNGVGSVVTSTQTTGANSHEASCCNSPVNPATTYNLGAVGNRLAVGTHILAIVGLNQAANSSDFHLIADLAISGAAGSTVSGAFGSLVTSNVVTLNGSNTVAGSTRVTINGDDASYTAGDGRWSHTRALRPGVNELYITALDAGGNILSNVTHSVIYQTAAVTLSGTLASSEVVSNAGTVVYVPNSVIVPAGVTLDIANGAVVLVNPGQSIVAQNGGRIYVHGAADQLVYFNVNGQANALWGPLSATGGGSSLWVEFADVARGQVNAINLADGTVQDCALHDFDNISGGTLGRPIMMCNNANLFEARRLHIWNYYECLVRNGLIHVEDCLFERMTGDALDFDSAQPGSYSRRCTYRHGNLGNVDAIDIGPGDIPGSTDTRIENCIMWDFPFDKGVSVGDGGSSHGIIVSNCLIYGCQSGVMSKDLCDVSIRNCTIIENTSGFTNYNKANPSSPTGGGIITNSYNNILWNNITTIGLANDGRVYADHNDFGNTNWPGDGNIDVDPLFVNAAARDFRLQPGSPCRGIGRDGADMGVTYPLGGIPARPLRFVVFGNGTNAPTMSWSDDSQNEDGVIVQRSTDGSNWQTLASLQPQTSTYTDNSAVLGQKYYYRVQHTNYVGSSPYSNIGTGARQAPTVNVGGTIATDTVWASGSHYVVTSSITVAAGATLTIGAGVNVCFDSGTGMTVANNGRLLAVGTSDAPILFTRSPSNTGTWTGLTINGSVGSPETRIEYARFEFTSQSPCIDVSAGTVFLDHLTFGTTTRSYLHVDDASFIVQNCVFPDATAAFELVHGNGAVKSGGHGIFQRNFFGKPIGYNDVVDFTGGNRPGPIIHFINNVFGGATDDELDLDGTDAWVEGNIFLHVHKNGSPDTASGISGGPDGGQVSDITVIGNIFYDCDHAAMAKGGNFFTLINNTVVHQTKTGGTDDEAAIVALADEGFSEATGMYIEGNIFYDAEQLTRFYTNSALTFTNNIFPANLSWTGAGGDNIPTNPDLTHVPQLSETLFSDWASAQIMKDWFRPQAGSPAIGSGPNGRDKGGVVPIGVSISGEPSGSTTQSNATLMVGVRRTGNGIPSGGANFPLGSGYTHYKWRLDGGAWSAETPITVPIALNNLSQGPHYVEVTGRRDSGLYQDDPRFSADAVVTRSRTWTVGEADSDGDGMPNSYEIAQGFNPNNPADAQQDADSDGSKNVDEYLAGTDPHDANSKLSLQVASVNATTATLRFTAMANKSYTIQYRDSVGSGAWQNLVPIPSQGTTHTVTYPDSLPPGLTSRFYRLVTPIQ